jgi:hypothetical protein
MSEPDREPEDLEGEGPAVLPEREAMSILSQTSESDELEEEADLGDT